MYTQSKKMAEFLTTLGVSHEIEDIIIKANEKLILLSPYLQLSDILKQRLLDASNRGVEIIVIYGKDELKSNERAFLSDLDNLNLGYLENLHAKCYYNESKMVLSSMNLYEFSERNNREMGILIKKAENKILYEDSLRECESIINISDIQVNGYCIVCRKKMKYNFNTPYCKEHYKKGKDGYYRVYSGSYCLLCGSKTRATKKKPLCKSCWYKVRDLELGI